LPLFIGLCLLSSIAFAEENYTLSGELALDNKGLYQILIVCFALLEAQFELKFIPLSIFSTIDIRLFSDFSDSN
jgi:hypothetical protein